MKKLEQKTRKLLRTIFGGLSLTAVAFIFQACYGPGPAQYYSVKLTGTVKSQTTKLPIKGIQVCVSEHNFGTTDENGNFDFYASVSRWGDDYDVIDSVYYSPDKVRVHFLDIDSTENGYFNDTTIIIDPAYYDEVKINVELSEKK